MKWYGLNITYIVRFLLAVILYAACALVVHADTSPSAVSLTMETAIEQAIQTNLMTALAKATDQEARARVIQTASALLPQVIASIGQERVFKVNYAAQGFPSTPLMPNLVVGPFNVFDSRLQITQKLLDVQSIWSTKSASAQARAAALGMDIAQEDVASAAALSYIEALRAQKAIQAAQADLELAARLSAQAGRRRDAGMATGIDLTRADTRTAQARHALILAKRDAIQADIRLKRVVGLPFDGAIMLVERQDLKTTPEPQEALIARALQDRAEIRYVRENTESAKAALVAAKAGFLPTVVAFGDYGWSGNLPDGSARTGSIGGRLDLPIFEGRRTVGEIREAEGRLNAAESRASDTRRQVEEDARLALETLKAELDEIGVAELRVQLAEREVEEAENRFGAGVGDNIQVVDAQTSLAQARQVHTDAWARLADAQANLALAVGHMKTFQF
jgi:outer membrane protein TolC